MNSFSASLLQLTEPFFRLSRIAKTLISLWLDGVLILISFVAAYLIRYESFAILEQTQFVLSFLVILFICLSVLMSLGLYRAVVRYIGLKTTLHAAIASLIAAALVRVAVNMLDVTYSISVTLNFAFFMFCSIAGWRLVLRHLFIRGNSPASERVLIYGAGASGRQLALALASSREYHPLAFVDDDVSLHGSMVNDLKVLNPQLLPHLVKSMSAKRILLALPSSSRSVRAQIISRLEHLGVPVQTIPGMADLADGKMQIDDLQDVKIEDLLGRDPVAPVPALISANVYDKVVLVTGAGGSIGSELCRQVLLQEPKLLVLFEQSEYSLYEIDKELQASVSAKSLTTHIFPILGSVQDQQRLFEVMQHYQVQTVYHAAAYKHVPLVEFNVLQGLRNNVFGTFYAASAAIDAGVEHFVLISTDKAVRPTNVMGTTKRLAELVLQGLAKRQQRTRFSMVRFGNVLGSSGSVVPLFRKQISEGGPVTLTHEEITRYFMTIPEAAQLVIQAGAMAKGGDVFVLDMGEPVRIYDLAVKMIRLSGLEVKSKQQPHGDIEIRVTGLRPGEKLYEELLIGDDEKPTRHPRIRTASEVSLEWPQMQQLLADLQAAADNHDLPQIRQLMLNAPTGFNPTDGICDLLFQPDPLAKPAKIVAAVG